MNFFHKPKSLKTSSARSKPFMFLRLYGPCKALQSSSWLCRQKRSNGDRNWLTIMRRLCGRLPEEFAEDVRLNHPGAEHILWVTHEPNIHTLFCKDIYMGESFTVQAEAWNDIFKTDRREITTPLSRIEARTKDSNEAMEMLKAFYCDDCTDDERRMIDDRLSFFTY